MRAPIAASLLMMLLSKRLSSLLVAGKDGKRKQLYRDKRNKRNYDLKYVFGKTAHVRKLRFLLKTISLQIIQEIENSFWNYVAFPTNKEERRQGANGQ